MENIMNESELKFGSIEKSPEENLDNINEFFKNQLKRMQKVKEGDRIDVKFTVLKNFIKELDSGNFFDDIYNSLAEIEKHAIITRLENIAMDGKISYDLVDKLEEKLYGTVINEEGEKGIDLSKKFKLEKALQKENNNLMKKMK